MKKMIYVLSLLFTTLLCTPVIAVQGHGTPDDEPPALESDCDGLPGAAYGLCVAYCEAQDCDTHPGKRSCDVLYGNWYDFWYKYDESAPEIPCGCIGEGCTPVPD